MLPARVTLSLYFFQETRDKKKLVASLLKLHSYHDPRPEGRTTKDGKTLIEPKDLSPPACCIIQRHPTKCSEIYIDDNGKEKTMQIPSDLGVFSDFGAVRSEPAHLYHAQALRERLEQPQDPQGEAPQLPAPGHLHGAQLVGIAQLFPI